MAPGKNEFETPAYRGSLWFLPRRQRQHLLKAILLLINSWPVLYAGQGQRKTAEFEIILPVYSCQTWRELKKYLPLLWQMPFVSPRASQSAKLQLFCWSITKWPQLISMEASDVWAWGCPQLPSSLPYWFGSSLQPPGLLYEEPPAPISLDSLLALVLMLVLEKINPSSFPILCVCWEWEMYLVRGVRWGAQLSLARGQP